MQTFGSNIDLRKVDFLSQEKVFIELTLRDVFVYKAGAFTYFLRTCFLKSMLLLNFLIQ